MVATTLNRPKKVCFTVYMKLLHIFACDLHAHTHDNVLLWCPVKDRYRSVADLGCGYKMM